jgi:hypothetical protein
MSKNANELEDLVQCVICLLVPRTGHIFQCRNGHLTCNKCSEKGQTFCGVCRVSLSRTRIRNIAVEQMIDRLDFLFPCAHGCDFSTVRRKLKEHENECASRMVPCPDGWCTKTIPFHTLIEHVDATEKRQETLYCDGVFSMRSDVPEESLESERLSWNAKICKYAGATFFAKMGKTDETFFVWLYIAAGAEEAKKYQVKITVADSTTSLSFSGKVFPIDLNDDEVIEEDVLSFRKSYFRKVSDYDKESKVSYIWIQYKISKL